MIPSPPPAYNFDPIPTVTTLDDFWYRKYGETEDGRLVRIARTEDVAQPEHDAHVHLPSPSYWPIVTAFGLPIVAYGLIFSLWLCIPGALIVITGLYGWVTEHPDDPDAATHHGPTGGGTTGEADESHTEKIGDVEKEVAPLG
jgi:cytochrome c oxidase subunit 1